MKDEPLRVAETSYNRFTDQSNIVLGGPGGHLRATTPGEGFTQLVKDLKPGQRVAVTFEVVDPPPAGWHRGRKDKRPKGKSR